jgi:mono/diheme cytochrome c family protein
MVAAIEGNRMPMGKPGTVPPASIATLKAWAAAGAPADPALPGSSPTPAPSPAATATPAPTKATVSFGQHVVPILKDRCAACHTFGGSGAGKVQMFSVNGNANYFNIKDKIDDMIDMIQQGKMPKGAPGTVPASEIQTLRTWESAGSPNN